MAILSTEPIVIPEVVIPEKIYNIWWVEKMTIEAHSPTYGAPVKAIITFRLASRTESGLGEFHPTEPSREIVIEDIFTAAGSISPTFALNLDSAMTTLGDIAKTAGVIK